MEDKKAPADFENEYVHKFYGRKAEAFSETRYKPWPFTLSFMERYATKDSLVLNSGWGNGRQFLTENIIGLDFSERLLREARSRPSLGLVRGNAHDLPFKDSVFDIVTSIAVIHHLSTHERRLRCIQEIHRVLAAGFDVVESGVEQESVYAVLQKREALGTEASLLFL